MTLSMKERRNADQSAYQDFTQAIATPTSATPTGSNFPNAAELEGHISV